MNTQRQTPWRARCVERRTPGSASGLGKRTESNLGTAPQADSPASSPDLPPHSRIDRGAPDVVFAAMAVSHWIETPNRLEHQEIRSHPRRYRTVQIQAGSHTLTAADPLPDDLREILTNLGSLDVH